MEIAFHLTFSMLMLLLLLLLQTYFIIKRRVRHENACCSASFSTHFGPMPVAYRRSHCVCCVLSQSILQTPFFPFAKRGGEEKRRRSLYWPINHHSAFRTDAQHTHTHPWLFVCVYYFYCKEEEKSFVLEAQRNWIDNDDDDDYFKFM